LRFNPCIWRAYQSTVCNFSFGKLEERFKKLESTHHAAVVAVWGDNDTVCPTEIADDLKKLNPSLSVYIRPDTTHRIVIEDPEFIASTVDNFFTTY
jgi:pimeloyl-ACP methyl ester carboxylesterase